MITELKEFEDSDLNVKFVARECNGKFLFPAAPIIKALGYTNLHTCLESNVFPEYQFRFRRIIGKGGKPTVFLNEPGLYQLIMRSNKYEAKKFQKWVFEYVLPSLRSNGYVLAKDATETQLNNAKRALGIAGEQEVKDAIALKEIADRMYKAGQNKLNCMNEMPNEGNLFAAK